MSRIRTLADLLGDIAGRLDVPPFDTDTYVTDETMTRWVNQSNRRLGDMVRDALGEDYGSATQTISVVAGTSAYGLDSAYIRTLDMFSLLNGRRVEVARAPIDAYGSQGRGSEGFGYNIIGGSVVFSPTPDYAVSVYHRYLPNLFAFNNSGTAILDLSSDSDYLDGVNGWEEWVVLDCCCKHASTEDKEPPNGVLREKKEIEDQIKARKKRTGAPLKLRDVYGGDCQ